MGGRNGLGSKESCEGSQVIGCWPEPRDLNRRTKLYKATESSFHRKGSFQVQLHGSDSGFLCFEVEASEPSGQCSFEVTQLGLQVTQLTVLLTQQMNHIASGSPAGVYLCSVIPCVEFHIWFLNKRPKSSSLFISLAQLDILTCYMDMCDILLSWLSLQQPQLLVSELFNVKICLFQFCTGATGLMQLTSNGSLYPTSQHCANCITCLPQTVLSWLSRFQQTCLCGL